MLYSNTILRKKEKEMEWGTLHQFEIGESGRGRRLICLPCSPDMSEIERGLHSDLSIGTTKTGRPRIVKQSDDKLFLILSSEGGYTRRGNGTIWVPQNQADSIKLLARGNGADGDAGRIGFWECMLIETPLTDTVIRVRTSGKGYGTPSDFYLIHEACVYHCTTDTLEACCEECGLNIPAGINIDFDSLDIDIWCRL